MTQFNKTPLHFAAEIGNKDVVQTLLNRGANIEAVTMVTNYKFIQQK